ncbi:hypothetical protein ACIGFK_19695 [Streptomyces sp. NPDC085524]|uniref:hypothetical protein n=1 Tax=unclassified Streptomyces TaxID=2593676 RepID=UPI003698594A
MSAQEVGAAKTANDDRNDKSKDGRGGGTAAAELNSKDAYLHGGPQGEDLDFRNHQHAREHPPGPAVYDNRCGPLTRVMGLGMRGSWNCDDQTHARWTGITPNNDGTGVDAVGAQLDDEAGRAAHLDSATTVWSSVPLRSGIPNSPLLTIVGGRGDNW